MTAVGTPPATDADRAFWQGVLLGGGSTVLPRWAPDPVPGTAEVEVPLPDATLVALRRLADRLAVPLGSVLLAAHTRVLAALTGEPDVVTGYVAGNGGTPLPCRLRVDVGSWRHLIRAAARIGGYHRAALELLAADPDADPATALLLSADELVFQLDGLAGPHRELPDRRVHELVEEQARRRPDDVAAVHGNSRSSYGDLDARANRVARALLARGLAPEDVVAVVT